ncbi:hypothetical protein [Roseivirga misakiensis]|uniref:Uncharacterized protein n=1 Tax=Roseivirga misakiensis TaxID=1563681 RepID=A0A1E5T204_9BACT|nr:hypothetical protein [Roseivirga misakiensis]OEK05400.1 hypothetical protein BFP71_18590 [Roseivirga misakiensis]
MEFEEMKKIWDAQNGQAMYAIDETALHNRVINKKQKARRTADLTEKIFIAANFIASAMIIVPTIIKNKVSVSGILMAIVMLVSAGYIIHRRNKRLKTQDNFDESILGDLDNAIATADYQVKFSKTSRFYLLSVVVLSMTALLESGTPWWVLALVAVFFFVTYIAARWEHRTFYASQKRDLRAMREKLVNMENEEPESPIDNMI